MVTWGPGQPHIIILTLLFYLSFSLSLYLSGFLAFWLSISCSSPRVLCLSLPVSLPHRDQPLAWYRFSWIYLPTTGTTRMTFNPSTKVGETVHNLFLESILGIGMGFHVALCVCGSSILPRSPSPFHALSLSLPFPYYHQPPPASQAPLLACTWASRIARAQSTP